MKTWTTKEGITLNISDMETSHIKNVIQLLENNIVDPYNVHGYENGAETSLTHYLILETNTKLEEKIKIFKKELKKRKNGNQENILW